MSKSNKYYTVREKKFSSRWGVRSKCQKHYTHEKVLTNLNSLLFFFFFWFGFERHRLYVQSTMMILEQTALNRKKWKLFVSLSLSHDEKSAVNFTSFSTIVVVVVLSLKERKKVRRESKNVEDFLINVILWSQTSCLDMPTSRQTSSSRATFCVCNRNQESQMKRREFSFDL